jgi:hypothetical protein
MMSLWQMQMNKARYAREGFVSHYVKLTGTSGRVFALEYDVRHYNYTCQAPFACMQFSHKSII